MDGCTYTQGQAKRLVDLANAFHIEAQACAEASRWRSALVFMGSFVEAGLLGTAFCCEPELRRDGLWPHPCQTPIHKWELGSLVRMAIKAGWLRSRTAEGGDLFEQLDGDEGDAVRFLSRIRNTALHPGNYVMAGLDVDFDDPQHMQPTYEIVSSIAGMVFEKLADVLKRLPDPPISGQRVASCG